MITLVYGGSGSGKSEFAENLILSECASDHRYYIATMKVYGEEGKARVERHRRLRQGKGFQTLEYPVRIEEAAGEIPDARKASVLIECVSNLAANEMFDTEEGERNLSERTAQGILSLCKAVGDAVIVTNNIFEDGMEYEDLTRAYAAHLAEINRTLAQKADRVAVITAGLPVWLKGSSQTAVYSPSSEELPEIIRKQEGRPEMELVIGGFAQGKMEYVLKQQEEGRFNGPVLIVNHLQKRIRELKDRDLVLARILQLRMSCERQGVSLILICDETGCGVVPAEYEDRSYRETAGRVLCELSKQADRVIQVVCGCPRMLKGAP